MLHPISAGELCSQDCCLLEHFSEQTSNITLKQIWSHNSGTSGGHRGACHWLRQIGRTNTELPFPSRLLEVESAKEVKSSPPWKISQDYMWTTGMLSF